MVEACKDTACRGCTKMKVPPDIRAPNTAFALISIVSGVELHDALGELAAPPGLQHARCAASRSLLPVQQASIPSIPVQTPNPVDLTECTQRRCSVSEVALPDGLSRINSQTTLWGAIG